MAYLKKCSTTFSTGDVGPAPPRAHANTDVYQNLHRVYSTIVLNPTSFAPLKRKNPEQANSKKIDASPARVSWQDAKSSGF